MECTRHLQPPRRQSPVQDWPGSASIVSTLSPAALSVQAGFFDWQSLVNNLASVLVVKQNNAASPILNQFSAFLQDEWKLSPALNLSLGVRWEVNPAPTGKHGADAFTTSGDVVSPGTLKVEPRGTPLWPTSRFNLAPRLGVAWMAGRQAGRELVVRAGGGIFFDTGDQPALRAFSGLGFTASQSFSNVPLPATAAQLEFSNPVAPTYNNTEVFAFPAHLQLPYSVQWNIGVEKALGQNQSFTLSYVGADGRRLLQEQRRNVAAQNPAFGDVSYFPGGITSSYQAMQIKFQRSLARGLEALASYTWAHAFDYGSTRSSLSLGLRKLRPRCAPESGSRSFLDSSQSCWKPLDQKIGGELVRGRTADRQNRLSGKHCWEFLFRPGHREPLL